MSFKSCDVADKYNSSKYFSNQNDFLLRAIDNDSELQSYTIDFECNELKEVKHYFDAPVESWPVIVNDEFVGEIESIGDKIIRILKKVLLSYQDRIIDYASLNEDQDTINLSFSKLREDETLLGLLLRFDLVISEDEFKIIEINSGSSIGGWHLDFLERLIKSNFNKDDDLKELEVNYDVVLKSAFTALFAAVKGKIDESSGHFVVFADKDDVAGIAEIKKVFDEVKSDFFPDAMLIPYDSDDELEFLDDGSVEVNGTIVDVVLLNAASEEDVNEDLYSQFLNSFLNDKIIFPDNIGHSFLGAKHLMAMLFEEDTISMLSDEENQLIEKYFPWTCKSLDSNVRWKNKSYQTRELLLEHKNDFVIKKAFSSEGLDVFVGCSMTDEEWEEQVNDKVTDNRWIVQEYFEPDPVTVFSYPFNFVEKAFSWGSFIFNTHYQGSLVRAVFCDQDKVINSARGAILTVVYEDDYKNQESDTCNI